MAPPVPSAAAGAGATFEQVLASSGLPLIEAQILLCQATGRTRVELVTSAKESLAPRHAMRFDELVARRRAGVPIAYLTGEREFYGRRFDVSPAVLIPRPETELMVDVVLAWLKGRAPPRILDLGSGSGVLAITLALECAGAQVTGIDRSRAALEVARSNGVRLGATIRWLESDWYSALGQEKFEVIVANPPYIASGDRHLAEGDLRFEPAMALASGAQGHDALAVVIGQAHRHLEPGGRLWVEHGYDQADWVGQRLAESGLIEIGMWCDLAGIPRVSSASRPV